MVSSARAAAPGSDGLLAVQPTAGPGVLLVNSHGGQQRRVCTDPSVCGSSPLKPRWSSDGQVIGFSSGPYGSGGVRLIYPDGSCLDCQPISTGSPAFTTNSSLIAVVAAGRLVEYGIDGIQKTVELKSGVSDAAWSSRGVLAVVRDGRVWVGSPGRLRSLGPGSSPSWSPDGSRIVIDRGGWLTVVGVRARSVRRLVRGSGPAWSPDGRSIAFIAKHHELSVVPASGGRARRVGNVSAKAVDWQPRPTRRAAGCVAPPGSVSIASSSGAVVTSDSVEAPDIGFQIPAYMGCLRTTGRERLLERFGFQSEDSNSGVSGAAVAGNYAALANFADDPHYGGSSEAVSVYALRTGAPIPGRGGETVSCPDYEYSCLSGLDGLVINSDGFTAAHTTMYEIGCFQPPTGGPCPTEEIQASDSTGLHVLDSATSQFGFPVLTDLALSGDTLTWKHGGAPESAQLN
jgi:hypothetical protein